MCDWNDSQPIRASESTLDECFSPVSDVLIVLEAFSDTGFTLNDTKTRHYH